MSTERVRSLAAVAEAASAAGGLSYPLRDFLDGFYAAPSPEKLSEEPRRLAGALGDGGVADAWLAAVGDHLSRRHGFARPGWVRSPDRVLAYPHFAAQTHGLRMVLLQESPPAFRERNLFVSANALSRA
jgi:hypothetical protein